MNTNKIFNIVKYTLVTIAAINLVLLFGFRYELPDSVKNKFFKGTYDKENLYVDKDESADNKEASLILSFDTDNLQYDGTSDFNLLSGVTLTDKDGNPVELDIYSTIESTEDSNIKLITYSVKDENGNEATAERTLTLHNYSGPTLSVRQPYPEIFDVELDRILDTFLAGNLLSATDGYSKNITNAIQCSYRIADDDATTVEITFTITNHFDDTISKTIMAPISRTKPLIVLKSTSVTIKKGETIDPLSFIESATNEEGHDLTSLITINSSADSSDTGNYTLTYTLTDTDQEQADPVSLKVTVTE